MNQAFNRVNIIMVAVSMFPAVIDAQENNIQKARILENFGKIYQIFTNPLYALHNSFV